MLKINVALSPYKSQQLIHRKVRDRMLQIMIAMHLSCKLKVAPHHVMQQ